MQFFRYMRFVENMLYPVRWAKSWLGRLFKFGGKGPTLSFPGKIALTVFLLFLMLWGYYLFVHWGGSLQHSPSQWFGFGPSLVFDFIFTFLLVVLLTVCTYWSVRLATLEQESLYPEIDQCWDAVNGWREERNFEWHDFTRFLVLGTDFATCKNMHVDQADNKDEPLMPVGSEEWIHSFGSKREMYIHLNETCNSSRRISQLRQHKNPHTVEESFATLEADGGFGDSLEADNLGGIYGATEEVGNYGGGDDYGGTISPDDVSDVDHDIGHSRVPGGFEEDTTEQNEAYGDEDYPEDRLQYFCELIRKRVGTEMPFSALMVAIPFDVFDQDNYQSIADAIRKDLVMIRHKVQINFPVVFAFTSMETDNGFPKLQNLLGKQRAKSRFGAGCKPQSPPALNPENFDLQVERACGTFETWVFDRWSKNSQLSRAIQNKDLYKMVIRIRQGFKFRLKYLLENSLIWKESELPEGEENDLVLAGCYFVSTGRDPGSRGFLPGLFNKCSEFFQLSGWSESALLRDRIYSTISSILFLGSALVVLFLVYLIAFQ